ncbi:hypothetical protein GGF46_005098 [Coemansia sp. RSA 552]|nr:hypothetical protein GGF46_005098 [Coemansia sp. RSA 552]
MDDEGPAFLSFSGLPGECVYDFVNNVDALRKHFKWSPQVTFCYARTMLKGPARKQVQQVKATAAATSAGADKDKGLGEDPKLLSEFVDSGSWSSLKSALVFEYADQYTRDRLLVRLLSVRQQAGESGSEYARRFVDLVGQLVALHPVDSNLLAAVFVSGLRSDKTRWELLLRRLNTVDKAIGYVAPDQLYRAAKLTSLLSPLPVPSAGADAELSPASSASLTFTSTLVDDTTGLRFDAEDDGDGDSEEGVDMAALCISEGAEPGSAVVAHGSTANGASFSLDDGGAGDEGGPPLWSAPAASASASAVAGYGGMAADAPSGYWTPPRLPDAQQRRQHRHNMAAYARENAMEQQQHSWTPGLQHRHSAILPRSSGTYAHSEGQHADDYYHAQENYAPDSRSQSKASVGTAGSEADDQQTRSASELNSLADQLESLSSMLRTQSDARRRRPRLCYRCRQKGHIAAECPLPPDMAIPNQQTRERMGLASPAVTPQQKPQLSRSATSSASAAATWRATSNRTASPSRRYTQSWGWNGPHQHNPSPR